MPSLEVELAGLRLRNPTVLASGILGTSASLARRVEEAGAGAFTTKTITPEPRRGYENPTFVELEHGFLNAIGLANPGIEAFCSELRAMRETLSIPVILSAGGGRLEDFVEVAARGVECGAQAVELNVSCPHVKGMGAEVGDNPEVVARIVAELSGSVEAPVLVKLSPHHDYLRVAEKAIGAGASGLTAINTIRGMAIDIYARRPVLSNRYGGYSGPGIRPVAVKVVYDLYERFGDVPIIGVGGVDSWQAAVEMILAGASAVGVGSSIAKKDLALFSEIARGLSKYLEDEGFASVKEIVGLAHKF
ncbi:dihydroorotate dehydrogenase PyrD [Infirmifilum sp. NZ]|uniref:dihydroorotate dehydrogenase PyrD n=1 Tax=Infirmifilum sp. NZ TaxID=2926850 RepID=UPI0027A1B324|nr:dihydroorotate dehydrogenase PyrD [Infirmifilum sp. NZ]UNQ73265.1 dihydroorotate dehydrogenase [Infirmifilum sp. NZ]